LYTVAYPLSFVHSCDFVSISPLVLSLLTAVALFLSVGVVVLDIFMSVVSKLGNDLHADSIITLCYGQLMIITLSF